MTANNNRRSAPGKPSLIEHRGMNTKFLIVNRPTTAALPQFIKVSSGNGFCLTGVLSQTKSWFTSYQGLLLQFFSPQVLGSCCHMLFLMILGLRKLPKKSQTQTLCELIPLKNFSNEVLDREPCINVSRTLTHTQLSLWKSILVICQICNYWLYYFVDRT